MHLNAQQGAGTPQQIKINTKSRHRLQKKNNNNNKKNNKLGAYKCTTTANKMAGKLFNLRVRRAGGGSLNWGKVQRNYVLVAGVFCIADAFKRLLKSAATSQNVSFHFILFSFLVFLFLTLLLALQLVLTLFKQHLLLSFLLNIFLNAVACRIIFISLEKKERERGK